MFASELCASLSPDERPRFLSTVEKQARPRLYREGIGWLDYVRLRVEATKPAR